MTEESLIARHIYVSGRVQGVGYRAFVERAVAHQTSTPVPLVGWVRNLTDSRVEAWIQGPSSKVLAVVAQCKDGPSASKVDRLEVREANLDTKLTRFEIRSTTTAEEEL